MDPICNHYQLSYYHDAYNRDHDEMFHTHAQNLSNGRMLKISKSEIGMNVVYKKKTWKIIAYLYFFPFLFENHLMHSPFHFFLVLDMGLAVDSDRCTHHDHTYVNQETLI